MPVQFECPHCGALIDQSRANRELPRLTCGKCHKDFATQWARKEDDKALPRGLVVSERFEVSRNFCNKLWNAARFTLINLAGYTSAPVVDSQLALEDRWLLSRLATVTTAATEALEQYRFADAARVLYDFAWDEFCSFYVEMAKGRLQDPEARPVAQRILAYVLDPMMPFITEEIWGLLRQAAPIRGIDEPQPSPEHIIVAPWPRGDRRWQDTSIEARFATFQATLGALREIRSRQNIAPRSAIQFQVRCSNDTAALLQSMQPYFGSMANAQPVAWGPEIQPPATAATMSLSGMDVFVDLTGLIDVAAELSRNEKEEQKLLGWIQGKQAKLGNANFVARAKPDVVAAERDGLAKMEEQLATVRAALAELRRQAASSA
jgi:valyl-tRNA synthetase